MDSPEVEGKETGREVREKVRKQSLLAISALALAALVLIGIYQTKTARALEASSYPPVVQKLIDKFGLNKTEVDTALTEVHQEKLQQRQALMKNKLEQAVEDKVITAEQKQALLNKLKEMEEKRLQEQEEMGKWQAESGIDFGKLAPYGVGFGGLGFGKGFGRGWHRGGF